MEKNEKPQEKVKEEEKAVEEVIEKVEENKKVEPYNSKEIPRNRYRPVLKTNATKVHELEIYLINLIHEKVNSVIQEEINIDKLSVDYSMDKRVLSELKVKLNSKSAYKDIITMYLIPILKKYSIHVDGDKNEIKQMMERQYTQHTRPPNQRGNAPVGRYRNQAGRDRDNLKRNRMKMVEKRKQFGKTRGMAGTSKGNNNVLKRKRQTLIKKRGRK